jgi:hypothetical protein
MFRSDTFEGGPAIPRFTLRDRELPRLSSQCSAGFCAHCLIRIHCLSARWGDSLAVAIWTTKAFSCREQPSTVHVCDMSLKKALRRGPRQRWLQVPRVLGHGAGMGRRFLCFFRELERRGGGLGRPGSGY